MRRHGLSESDWERADDWHDRKVDRVAAAEDRAAHKAATPALLPPTHRAICKAETPPMTNSKGEHTCEGCRLPEDGLRTRHVTAARQSGKSLCADCAAMDEAVARRTPAFTDGEHCPPAHHPERLTPDFPTAYIPGCEWQDPEDACCLHHDNMTPECTRWACPLVAAKPLTRHPERLTPEQDRLRGEWARQLASGANIPFSLFL